jgi:surface polysaccharide O-acyltransferase-like enzyme
MEIRTRKREANIEVMRLILLVMVITLHVVAPYRMSRYDKLDPNWIFTDVAASLSRLCTNAFVLVSGFFFTSFKGKSAAQTAARLILPVMLYLPFYLFLELDQSFGEALNRVVIGALTSRYNMYHLWFVQTFLALSLIAPLFVGGLEQSDQKTHRLFMWVLITVSSVLPTFTFLTGLAWFDLRLFNAPLVLFLALFVTGAYIRKYPPRLSAAAAGLLLIAAQLVIIYGSRLYNSRYSPVSLIKLLTGEIASLDDPAAVWIETNAMSEAFANPSNTVIVAATVLLFVFFLNIRVQNAVIPKITRHIYGAYVIHLFWIVVFSRAAGGRFDLFSAYWHDHPSYPLYVIIYILAVLFASLLTNLLFGCVYAAVRRTVLRNAHHFQTRA